MSLTRAATFGRLQSKAQSAVARAVKSGKLIQRPCEKCGNPKSEGHHPDYEKPLEVVWLCSKHHKLVHAHQWRHPNLPENKIRTFHIFQDKVLKFRSQRGCTQTQFVEWLGISRRTIARIEAGKPIGAR